MSRRPLAAAALALLMTSTQLAAIYMRIETRQVPTDRLIANLERELKADPTNVQTSHQPGAAPRHGVCAQGR